MSLNPNTSFNVPGEISFDLRRYASAATASDLMLSASAEMSALWVAMLADLGAAASGGFSALQDRAARQVVDLGIAFRLAGEANERPWPLSPLPLLIPIDEWQTIERGLVQRANLLETIVGDLYGPATLIADGHIPAAAVTGSPGYWPQMNNVRPPAGNRLQFYAVDLARGPAGDWSVLADHVRAPVGAGYALENRLAMGRATDDLLGKMNVRRLAPFFASFRRGLAACCERVDPRIALLTPGRFNPSYPEQAHLARYLGFLLVEGEDLAVKENRLYVRTIEGLKRIDALWRRLDARFLDPLAFDVNSKIGVPDLHEVMGRKGLAIANWPGVGVAEAPVFAAFLPRLSRILLGEDLALPNIATWWCGQDIERGIVRENLGRMAIGSALGRPLPAIPSGSAVMGSRLTDQERESLLADMDRRPMDYVGQEIVQLSTTPALLDGKLVARPFILRAFLARDADGSWRVMPGGFAQLAAHEDVRAAVMGEGDMSADVCIVLRKPEPVVSLLDEGPTPRIRRVAGTLPSKAADNFYWLARYLERAEVTLRMIRVLLGGTLETDSAFTHGQRTLARVANMLIEWETVSPDAARGGLTALCRSAIDSGGEYGSVHALFRSAESIAQGLRERLASDVSRVLARPRASVIGQSAETLREYTGELIERCAALSGLAAENMVRGQGWIFYDLGRRIERAINTCNFLRVFAGDEASSDDLGLALNLCDSQISFRTRYLSRTAAAPVRDMLGLEPDNPRSLIFQITRIVEHLRSLPSLSDDGMPELPVKIAAAIAAKLAASDAYSLSVSEIAEIEQELLALSDAVGDRFFLQGPNTVRATGMTRLA